MVKNTNLKVNHNGRVPVTLRHFAVSNGSKDTNLKANHNDTGLCERPACGCFQWIKDTNLKTNHNAKPTVTIRPKTVSCGAQDTILINT